MTLWVLLLAVVYVAYKLCIRFFIGPHSAGQEMAMKVWAASGPYDSAEFAAVSLRRAAKVVFAPEELPVLEQWVQGHIQNFNEWERENRFPQCQEMMRSALLRSVTPAVQDACNRFRTDLVAEVAKGDEWINSEFLEQGGHRLEVVNRPDGGVDVQYNQIWSDEAIRWKKREDAESLMTAIGARLLNDESDYARRLVLFLKNLHGVDIGDSAAAALDIGRAWIVCMNHACDEPNSETSRTFKSLNGAWVPADAG